MTTRTPSGQPGSSAEGERLQKVLARAGFGSRRAAEELIAGGRVTVDGAVARLGQRIDPDRMHVEVDGVRVPVRDDVVYYLLNKPRRVVTTARDPEGRTTAVDLVPTKPRVFPVGRLDYDTEGFSSSPMTASSRNSSLIRVMASRRRTSPRSQAYPRVPRSGLYARASPSTTDRRRRLGSASCNIRATTPHLRSSSTRAATASCGACVKPSAIPFDGSSGHASARSPTGALRPERGVRCGRARFGPCTPPRPHPQRS